MQGIPFEVRPDELIIGGDEADGTPSKRQKVEEPEASIPQTPPPIPPGVPQSTIPTPFPQLANNFSGPPMLP